MSSTTTYYIWKARCSLVFHQVRASPVELVNNIWLDIVHTLKGKWDHIIGDSDDKTTQCHQFLTLWKATLLMSSKNGTPFRHFQAPRWFIPFAVHLEIKTM